MAHAHVAKNGTYAFTVRIRVPYRSVPVPVLDSSSSYRCRSTGTGTTVDLIPTSVGLTL